MKQQTFIFIGRSGCGKGTQCKLLSEYLRATDSSRDILYVQSGNEFRKFIEGHSHTQKLSKAIYDVGGLQPEFLAIYMWVNFLVTEYKGTEHIIMDGMPRKFHEAGTLDSIFDFYKLPRPYVIYLNVGEEWSIDRMMSRGRIDDTREEIKTRLSWFETDVVPTINYYKSNPLYTFIEINGERSREDIHKDILDHLKF